MKNLAQHIFEKLQISRNKPIHTLFPKNKRELTGMIHNEIEKNGPNCSLNHIDVSKIEDFSYLFTVVTFDGNISDWDVSNAKTMQSMFKDCFRFTGKNSDISNWDVSNVTDMELMFCNTAFNKDISNWDVSNVRDMNRMFMGSNFNGDITNWDVSNVKKMQEMFRNCPLEDNPPKWYKE